MPPSTAAQAAASAALAKLDAQAAAAAASRAEIAQLSGELANLRASARSPQGEINVAAQSSGRVLQITVTERATQLSAARLSQLLTDTVAAAQHQAALLALERSTQTLGADSPLQQQLRAEALAAFPAANSATQQIGYH